MLGRTAVFAKRAQLAFAKPALFAPSFGRFMSTIYFSKDHEYVNMDGKIGTVGISDHAQSQLGDVVYVGLPEVGEKFAKGDTMASVESVKAASDIYAPVSGTIVEVNAALVEDPSLVNQSAEDKAWFVKIELDNQDELKELMSKDAYLEIC